MPRPWLSLGCLVAACFAAATSGCMRYKPPDPTLWFRTKPRTQAGIITPLERRQWLEQVAEQAAELDPAQQQQRALELAQGIQREEDPMLRGEILRTIARLPTETTQRVLTAARNDTDADVRVACCEAWAIRGGPEAKQALVEVLKNDTDIDVRLSAVRELGNLGDKSAVSDLGKLLEDRDPAMQYRAVLSLEQLTGKDFGDDVNAWREFVGGGDPPEKPLAARLLRRF